MIATTAIVMVLIYRDGVSNQLGFRTFINCLISIGLTVIAVVAIPALFQLTYYSANRLLLQGAAERTLLVNEEKRQSGVEFGLSENTDVKSTGEFAIQLDWVKVPWYESFGYIIKSDGSNNAVWDTTFSTLDHIKEAQQKAIRSSAIAGRSDVTAFNDGMYITTDDLFDSVNIAFNFNAKGELRNLQLQNFNQQRNYMILLQRKNNVMMRLP